VRDLLVAAFDEYGLLVFEGVEPTPEMQVAISTVFGPLKDHPSSATTACARSSTSSSIATGC
jgi:taurine dioxygenase